ncbi:hypothetical protein [Aquimarina brevivitae]|uniref:Uncharacterized protein n=1 Tax=Aquimarina brevivitae TaxID=323412 RepID=A0A4Q7P0N4_9FLAO|nr:hypothetical protein [Aquimarina brevivitae]RZS93107.1 hypothetical protein EV197_1677 [Aquimarina brevivitae]
MLKNILNLKGTQRIKKGDQQTIIGGRPPGIFLCCNPLLECCTTTHLALNNPRCGGQYQSGCSYHKATDCCA